MGLEREVFHICRLPHIFHFSISVDISAAFIQLAGLALMLSPGPGNKPMRSPTNQTDSWAPLLKTLVDSQGPALLGPSQVSFCISPWGQALLCRLGPEWAPLVLKSWGSRAWSCSPLAWSSSFSWRFLSSLASWSPCPRLKVRAHLKHRYWLIDTWGLVLLLSTAWLNWRWLTYSASHTLVYSPINIYCISTV